MSVAAGRGKLTVLAARSDFNDQGPAVEVETQLPADGAPDRRWLFVAAPEHDETARSGPLAIAVAGLEAPARVRLAVDPRPRPWLAWLGLGLLVVAGVLPPRRSR